MKKFGKLMCGTLALVMATGGLVGCGKDEEVMKTEGQSYISLRINPEIEFISNEDNLVIAANAINEDGEVVLSVSDFIGDTVEEASEEFVDTAVDLGYIDVESEESTVYVHIEGVNEEETLEIEEKVKNKVNNYFDNNGIFGKVEKEDMTMYKAKAEEHNRSVGHIKMITRVLELYPEKQKKNY